MAAVKKRGFPLISPLLFAGILLILLPIFTFMTMERLKKQKEFFTQRLTGRGISLIRTFEAGARTGFLTIGWGARRIQNMLFETSLQPGIVYIMITSKEGRIVAHSDTSRVGEIFHNMPAISNTDKDISLFNHRTRKLKDQTQVFEVFKRFTPVRSNSKGGRHMHMRGMMLQRDKTGSIPHKSEEQTEEDWSHPYLQSRKGNMAQNAQHYIFAGLSMAKEKIARERLLRQTIRRGVLFFALGCAGFAALFIFQGYRSAKESLTRVKAFSDNVIENMPSGLITINLNHEITSMNKTAKKILGKDLTRSLPQLTVLIEKQEISKEIISQEVNLVVSQNQIEEKTIGLDITASPIRDSENQITGFLLLFKDLTQIKKLKKQVETNRRLAAIGKFAAGVAHEIRNPLSSIKGFATYLGRRYEENSSDKKTADIMVKEVERINRSITQLLEFAKPMSVENKPVDVNDIIAHSLQLVHHDIVRKKIHTKIDVNLETPLINTDSQKMNQVLLNLYINAIQAMEENGKLTIRVSKKEQTSAIEIVIKDNGSGIEEDTLDLIFDPYFTTKPTGTGLGLSIVHTILENLGGSLKVQSTKGIGSCFTVKLPVRRLEPGD